MLATVAAAQAAPTGAAVDPYGKPLPTHAQALAHLEQLLGRTINDYRPIQRQPVGAATDPYDGPDNPVACTRATSVPAPTAADLAQTPDVIFTPEVQSAVSRIGADPRALYLYVKNGWVYTPYFGSQKGSRGTELEFSGNDYDQASFLIALLRYAGIPARYVFGTMYIPTDKALNWLQVDNATAAMNILDWQGIPAEFVDNGRTLAIARVWVEAYVVGNGNGHGHWDGQENGRGESGHGWSGQNWSGHDWGGFNRHPRWVPMDPAFKQYRIRPASPLATAVSFNESAYLNLPVTDPRTPYEYLAGNLQTYLNTAAPGTDVDDVVRRSSIIPTFLPWNLPDRLENRVRHQTEQSALTDSQRYQVTVTTVDADGISAQATFQLPAIYSQRLTISFPPATASDQALVQSYGGYYNAPANELNVVASINLNGQAVATGSRSVSIGAEHYIVVDLLPPGATQPITVFHTVFAGGYYGLGLDVQGDMSGEIEARKQAYMDALWTVPDPTYNDATTGDFLSTTSLVYLNNIQSERLNIDDLYSASQVMDVSEDLTMKNITIEYVNGGWHFRPFGWTVDAQRIASNVYADNGDDSQQSQLLAMEGISSSFYESRLWDKFTSLQSISTTRGLQLANSEGIPIYTINQANAASLIPTLNVFSGVLQNVEDEISAGDTVIIPADTLIMNLWEGSVWIDQNANGTGYLIEGGLFGGSATQDPGNRQNPKPTCSSISDEINANSDGYDSDFGRAVAATESNWTQYDADGDPVINQNKNAKGQVTSADYGVMQVNDATWDGKTIAPFDGNSQLTISDQTNENTQQNILLL